MTAEHVYTWRDEKDNFGNLREAVGVFQSEKDLEEAIAEFESSGFNHASFSRPVPPEDIIGKIHRPIEGIRDLEDDPAIPRETFTDPESFSSFKTIIVLFPMYILGLAAIAYGAATDWNTVDAIISFAFLALVGVGGGAYISWYLANRHEHRINFEKTLGGLLLWVRIGSRSQERLAMKIMQAHGAKDVHLHGPAA